MPKADLRGMRTITQADARAIAVALLKEATEQIYSATGRGIWSTFKTLFWPIAIGALLYFMVLTGRPLAMGPTK
ncbi:hypothetical protein [Novosphingobium sp. FSW06-99]|uniref:hypothetical protein n=1 Tax=Novosphingobium sp. FSW06-99 TaxID=1739113 RepID=UPI0012E3DA20|nr:hypothetical protein [Novosphingobium sp. FSW06-99]